VERKLITTSIQGGMAFSDVVWCQNICVCDDIFATLTTENSK